MKAVGTVELRSAIRQWLVSKNDLAARKNIRKHLEEGQGVHEMILKVLGVRDWKAALKMRTDARVAAKAAKQEAANAKAQKRVA